MGRMEYNDLWVILQNMRQSKTDLIPERFRDFIKAAMIPDAVSEIRTDIPLEEQKLSQKTRDMLASLYLTYWAPGVSERREFAEVLHSNEQKSMGQEPAPMSEDEYQELLSAFDYWNEEFGAIPFWSNSRNWYPAVCYEIVGKDEKAELTAGDTGLKSVYVPPEKRVVILEEARQWTVTAVTEHEEELYWHDDDISTWTSTKEIDDFYEDEVVIKDGHFIGALIRTEQTSSMGLSVYRAKECGILFIDGSTEGTVKENYFHGSSEVSESRDTVYSLKKKEESE